VHNVIHVVQEDPKIWVKGGPVLEFDGGDDLIFMTSPVSGFEMIDGQSVALTDREAESALFNAVANDKLAAHSTLRHHTADTGE
jgi:hypothetical protein